MQLVRTEQAYDRALVHSMSATLLRGAGRLKEAESEYRAALDKLHEAGRSESADTASTLNALALAYIEDRQYDEAGEALDREMTIINTAKDVVAMDRVALLSARGALRARRHQWLDAEQDLREAVSIADREKLLYPELAVKLLPDFAVVLRKVHRRAEARSIEARAEKYRRHVTGRALVDVSELAAKSGLK
jgi:tetratricopeptide (TPR) repeat protein